MSRHRGELAEQTQPSKPWFGSGSRNPPSLSRPDPRPGACSDFSAAEKQELSDHVGGDCAALLNETTTAKDSLICWFRLAGGAPRDDTKAATLSLAQLIRQLAGSSVRLHLVTEGATAGHAENGHPDVAAAAVWALGRSLITEGAVAISGMTDLEAGTDLAVALSQIGADLELGAEEVAWRGGRRFEHRLTPRPFRHFFRTNHLYGQGQGLCLVACGSCRVRGVKMVWPFRPHPAGWADRHLR